MILLDTNVISELVRPAPDPTVAAYVKAQRPDIVFISSVCEAEIRYGLARMQAGRRRDDLAARIDSLLKRGLERRVVPFDRACAAAYAQIRTSREAAGRPISTEDAMIAATAVVHGYSVVTRNVSDFAGCGAPVLNPWRPAELPRRQTT